MQTGEKMEIVVSTPQSTRKSAKPVVICEDQASIHLMIKQSKVKHCFQKWYPKHLPSGRWCRCSSIRRAWIHHFVLLICWRWWWVLKRGVTCGKRQISLCGSALLRRQTTIQTGQQGEQTCAQRGRVTAGRRPKEGCWGIGSWIGGCGGGDGCWRT